ncbi:MAG: hypothetical protein IKP79_00350 [Bacilli bacterium]|nr:hypothetical protein [Bacilli bacterium]
MDREYIKVSSYEDPRDYVNNEGLNPCYDVDVNEYAIAYDNEDIFASFTGNSTVIASINETGKFLFNGAITPIDAFKLLTTNNFVENSSIYIYSKVFDKELFTSMVDKVSDTTSITDIPIIDHDDLSINIDSSSLSIASDKDDIEYCEFIKTKKVEKTI